MNAEVAKVVKLILPRTEALRALAGAEVEHVLDVLLGLERAMVTFTAGVDVSKGNRLSDVRVDADVLFEVYGVL